MFLILFKKKKSGNIFKTVYRLYNEKVDVFCLKGAFTFKL